MQNKVKVHVFNGSPARITTADKALATLADMLGIDAAQLHRYRGSEFFSRWDARYAGELVGRIVAEGEEY